MTRHKVKHDLWAQRAILLRQPHGQGYEHGALVGGPRDHQVDTHGHALANDASTVANAGHDQPLLDVNHQGDVAVVAKPDLADVGVHFDVVRADGVLDLSAQPRQVHALLHTDRVDVHASLHKLPDVAWTVLLRHVPSTGHDLDVTLRLARLAHLLEKFRQTLLGHTLVVLQRLDPSVQVLCIVALYVEYLRRRLHLERVGSIHDSG